MKQIVDKLNKIAKAIDENVELSDRDLIIDSLDSITKAFGGTPNDSNLIVDKLDDIAGVAEPKPTGNIELTENGENINVAPYATATVNVSGGGGGGSDFSIANLTLIIPEGALSGTLSAPLVFEAEGDYPASTTPFYGWNNPDTIELQVVLYKGLAVANVSNVRNISGNITGADDFYEISGDCTITISVSGAPQ